MMKYRMMMSGFVFWDTQIHNDGNYASTSVIKTHAFKYTFTNINDDLQKGVSPIVQIGDDQKVNEKTRVILDGSASYDPDPTGRIVSFKWKYVGQRTDVTLTRENESIAYFTGPDISETTVMLFGLEVIDDDQNCILRFHFNYD